MIRSTLLWVVASALLFGGERIAGAGATLDSDAFALLFVITTLGLRYKSLNEHDTGRKHAQKTAFFCTLVGTLGLVSYGITMEPVTDALGQSEAFTQRWNGVFQSIAPILWVIGTLPALFLDMTLAANPTVLPLTASRRSTTSALTAALAVCLVFPINFMAA